MRTKINFKALDLADIEVSNNKPSEEERKAFSQFLAKRKKPKLRTLQARVYQ